MSMFISKGLSIAQSCGTLTDSHLESSKEDFSASGKSPFANFQPSSSATVERGDSPPKSIAENAVAVSNVVSSFFIYTELW